MSVVRTTCPYCGVGCGLAVSTSAGSGAAHGGAAGGGAGGSSAQGGSGAAAGDSAGIEVRGDETHPANFGRLCSKGAALAETLDLEGRLLEPVVHGRPASWDDTLSLVAGRFSAAIAEHGPDSVAFYVSGQLLTEDYYVANKLMKGFIGSGNIDTNSRLCMASAVAGYKRAFGADLVPSSYEDIDEADLVVVAGSNMAFCHPVLFQRLRAAKEARPGLEVVVVDPRRTETCDIADLHLPLRPGSDVALFAGLLEYLSQEEKLDQAFVGARTEGLAEALQAARASLPSTAEVALRCGLFERDVRDFYRRFAATPRTVTLFSQGINQSTSGTDKVNSIINVHLATGRIGKRGTGPFSLTGQPNAMGGREVGGLANQLAAHMSFSPEDRERVQRFWGAPAIAAAPGLAAVDLFAAAGSGRIKALWIMSTNPVVSMPDADAVRAAIERCDFVVVSDCMRETDTTRVADAVLPAAAWGEKSGTVTNSERRISRQRAFIRAPGMSRPDWWIVCEVAKRMGFAKAFDYTGPAAIFREHAALSAFENGGERDFDIGALADLSDEDYAALAPVRWPLPRGAPDEGALAGPLTDGRFFTPSRRARFVPTVPAPPAAGASRSFPFVMLTGRIRDQWHTMTRTGKSPRLAQTRPEPFVQIHPHDAIEAKLANGGIAEIRTDGGRMRARIEWSDQLRRGDVFVPMHWTGVLSVSGRVGPLIAAAVDPHSGQPELKATPVAIEPVAAGWHGFLLSREPVAIGAAGYEVRARGLGYWRYEIAGRGPPADWALWARARLGADGDWIEYADRQADCYRGARLVGGRLSGCLFVSPTTRLPDRGWLGRLFAGGALDEAARLGLLAGRPADAAAVGPVVCACHAVGRDALVRAIASRQATTVAAIGRLLKAGSSCGSCIPELNGLIAAHAGAAACVQNPQTNRKVCLPASAGLP